MRVATKTYAQPAPKHLRREKSDCSVRALLVAAEIPYEYAHNVLKAAGRVDRQGAYCVTMSKAAEYFGFFELDSIGGGYSARGKPTLAQFLREHRTGRFIVRLDKHFIAVVNGIVHNWWKTHNGPRSRVIRAWGRS